MNNDLRRRAISNARELIAALRAAFEDPLLFPVERLVPVRVLNEDQLENRVIDLVNLLPEPINPVPEPINPMQEVQEGEEEDIEVNEEIEIASDSGDETVDSSEFESSGGETDIEDEIPTCCICMGRLISRRKPYSTPCGHVFCVSCLRKALRRRKKCPLCNNPIFLRSLCSRLYF